LCEEGSRKSKHIFPDVNSTSLNDYLKTLLPGLTAKVFRTYKAGYTLQKQLDENSPSMDALTHEKKIYYDTANVKVALALNHKNLTKNSARIDKLGEKVIELKQKLKDAKTDKQKESARKTLELTEAKIEQAGENISLGTSKQNYIDPRISVAWCKKVGMPIEKLYSKSQLGKFKWAMEAKSDWKF
jgi:DNA topoisomerase-1